MARILAVDGDGMRRAVLVDALRALGHEPVAASGAAEAEKLFTAQAFAAVVLSVTTDEAFELARRLANTPPPVPLLLTGPARVSLDGWPSRAFVEEPVDADRIGPILKRLLASSGDRPDTWSGPEFLAQVSGPLERFPPLRVLFLAHRVAATGGLRVELPGGGALIGLRNGKIVEIQGVRGLLLSLGPTAAEGRDLAGTLGTAIAAGFPAPQVMDAAAEGLGTWLASLLESEGGSVRWDARWLPQPGAFPLPMPVPRLLAAGLVRGRPDPRIERTWSALGGAEVRVRLPDDAPESAWGIDAAAMRLLRLAPRSANVGALVNTASGGDPSRTRETLRALDSLHAFGLLVVIGGAMPAKGSARSQRTAEATQEDPRATRFMQALAAMETAAPVDILELGTRLKLTEDDVANAYRDISRRYHPDTVASAPPALRALADECFSRVNAAYDALRVPGGLAEARRLLEARAKGETFVSEKDHLAARVAFRRGELLFRNRDWKGADPLFQDALRLDPNTWPHAMYAAYTGWLARRLPLKEALAALDAVQPGTKPRAAEVQVFAGNILKLEERSAEAMERFRKALDHDPNNRDAQRELRLHELRNPAKKA